MEKQRGAGPRRQAGKSSITVSIETRLALNERLARANGQTESYDHFLRRKLGLGETPAADEALLAGGA